MIRSFVLAFVLILTVTPRAAAQCADLSVRLPGLGPAAVDADLRARLGFRLRARRPEADLRVAADLGIRARARFDAGAELDALADLEEAFRLSGDASLAGMLGLSLQAAGRLPEA